MSDNFAWLPDQSSRRRSMTARLAIVLGCAGLGIAAGALYPVKIVLNALERASLPRVTASANGSTTTVQETAKAAAPPETAVASARPSEPNAVDAGSTPNVVLLNPGQSEPATTPE